MTNQELRNESESDDDALPDGGGLMQFLKGKTWGKPKAKAAAKATAAVAKAATKPSKASAKSKSTAAANTAAGTSTAAPKAAPKAAPNGPRQTSIGGAAKAKAKQRGIKRAADEADVIEKEGEEGEGEGLSMADKAVLSEFRIKMADLLDLQPPVADQEYKQYLAEKLQGLNSISAELKTKKKSVGRRAGKSDDPLFIGLCEVDENVKLLQRLVKSHLVVIERCLVFS